MPSHDSPKTLRGEGKPLNEAKIAKAAADYNPNPHPNLGK